VIHALLLLTLIAEQLLSEFQMGACVTQFALVSIFAFVHRGGHNRTQGKNLPSIHIDKEKKSRRMSEYECGDGRKGVMGVSVFLFGYTVQRP
jgi:hypothetical protein